MKFNEIFQSKKRPPIEIYFDKLQHKKEYSFRLINLNQIETKKPSQSSFWIIPAINQKNCPEIPIRAFQHCKLHLPITSMTQEFNHILTQHSINITLKPTQYIILNLIRENKQKTKITKLKIVETNPNGENILFDYESKNENS